MSEPFPEQTAYVKAKQEYDEAESHLARARAKLTEAERVRNDAWRAIVNTATITP